MYGYIYIIVNKLSHRIYIGQHKKSYFDTAYWGSSSYLSEDIKKFGKNSFTRNVLCWCNCKKELDEKEKFYIKKYKSQDPDIGYNISGGGFGGYKGDLTPEQLKIVNDKMIQTKIKNGTLRFTKEGKENIRQGQLNLRKERPDFGNKAIEAMKNWRENNPERFKQIYNNLQSFHPEEYIKRKVICLELNKIFNSIKEAGDFCKKNNGKGRKNDICECCNNRQIVCSGYHWMYYDDYCREGNYLDKDKEFYYLICKGYKNRKCKWVRYNCRRDADIALYSKLENNIGTFRELYEVDYFGNYQLLEENHG